MGDSFVKWLMVTSLLVCPMVGNELPAQSVAVGVQPESPKAAAAISVHVIDTPLERVLRTIAQQAGLRLVYEKGIPSLATRITVALHQVPADEAFARVLSGTGLHAAIVSGNVLLEIAGPAATAVQGDIVGKVSDAKTKLPLRGASVVLDDTKNGAATGDNGMFRIAHVTSGSHVVHVRMLGYVKAARTVTVIEGQSVSVDVALDASVSALDQVIVTGTIVATERRAVPNAMTVITAKDIEQRGITQIQQLFRGDVPGLIALDAGTSNAVGQVVMFTRGATGFTGLGNPDAGTTAIKTYVDGVELADPRYLAQIDPRSIERIEILTGPQASTIYGSNAISGVMQVFTKRGTTQRPQLTAAFLSGFVQNNFSSALTPQHDYSTQVSGTEGQITYSAGGTWTHMGAWNPAVHPTTIGGYGGARLTRGAFQADASIRISDTQSARSGLAAGTDTPLRITGILLPAYQNGVLAPADFVSKTQTLGLTIGYTPTSWWHHEFVLGQDAASSEQRTAAGHASALDTLLGLSQSTYQRMSMRYATTAHVPVTASSQLTVTFGGDGWQNITTSLSENPTSFTGTLTASSVYLNRQPGHNTGGFVQGQLGIRDALFVTYGLRAEWNPTYGDAAQPNLAPRYGVAYTTDLGPVTTKLRTSYGRSTKPPLVSQKASVPQTTASYLATFGPYNSRYANPDLGPQSQQGWEGGLEMYLGTRGSLIITRYNQTVDDIILSVRVDSIRSLAPVSYTTSYPDNYDYNSISQYLNVGNIRNQGWELQGTANAGLFTARGTYSWNKSRVIGIVPSHRAQFANIAQYQPGAQPYSFPEHTWAISFGYVNRENTVTLNLNGMSFTYADGDALTYLAQSSRLTSMAPRGMYLPNIYRARDEGYVTADLNVVHRVSEVIEGVLQVQNLGDDYHNDYTYSGATLGRQVKAGVRLRL